MKIIIQRVSKASVEIDGKPYSKIDKGLLILLGIKEGDSEEQMKWLCKKAAKIRIFEDEEGKMNLSVKDIGGSILVVPNFTLYGNAEKGNRPSFVNAAKPDESEPIFEKFCRYLEDEYQVPVKKGKFGADMQVELINDGPVTIEIEK